MTPPAVNFNTLALNFKNIAEMRAFHKRIGGFLKECTRAPAKTRLQLKPSFPVILTNCVGKEVATHLTAIFHKTRSRAKGRSLGESIPKLLSSIFGGSGARGSPVRAAFLSLVGADNLAAAVAFLSLPSSTVTTYIPAQLHYSSVILTTLVSALYKREFPCPPKRHDEAAHLAALPAMAAMAAALTADCTAFVPLPGFQALFASIHGRAPTEQDQNTARAAGLWVKT